MSPSIVSPPVLTPHSQSAFTAVQPSKSYRAHLSPMVREGGREGGRIGGREGEKEDRGREGERERGRERGRMEGKRTWKRRKGNGGRNTV